MICALLSKFYQCRAKRIFSKIEDINAEIILYEAYGHPVDALKARRDCLDAKHARLEARAVAALIEPMCGLPHRSDEQPQKKRNGTL